MSFDGSVVVVTGGSRGLGKAMVEAYAARGADVVIASRRVESCVAVANEVRSRHSVNAFPIACNVSEWEQCNALVEATYSEFGRIDVLVNNAGLAPLYPGVDQVSESLFDKVIGVNLKGPFRLSALVGTRMSNSDGGVILNISSIEAIRPSPNALPYAAAKAGLNAMTEGMARTFGPRVRVNAIQCGPFLTDIASTWDAQSRDDLASTLALGRCAEPEEVVGAAMYLTGDGASFCTGAVLRLDGGMP